MHTPTSADRIASAIERTAAHQSLTTSVLHMIQAYPEAIEQDDELSLDNMSISELQHLLHRLIDRTEQSLIDRITDIVRDEIQRALSTPFVLTKRE